MNKLTTSTAIPTRALKLEALSSISASFELFCLASGMEALGEMMDVNAGEKLHRRAGAKLHHDGIGASLIGLCGTEGGCARSRERSSPATA